MSDGLHHVTAVAGAPARSVGFYTRVLGLRFVKRTVNFDDPSSYHLYFGDASGSPGSILTFFSWPDAPPGRPGGGTVGETAFRVPRDALAWWAKRFADAGVDHDPPVERFGEPALTFRDPDGTRLALVAAGGGGAAWRDGDVPAERATRGLHGVTLTLREAQATAEVLTGVLGLTAVGQEGARQRFAGRDGSAVDLHRDAAARPATSGGGIVHHVAFRAADDAQQAAMAETARRRGLSVTGQRDRRYFRAVYFREPGGVLFEIATDAPGFAVDEPPDALGTGLKLPPGLEPRRAEIEAALPPLSRLS